MMITINTLLFIALATQVSCFSLLSKSPKAAKLAPMPVKKPLSIFSFDDVVAPTSSKFRINGINGTWISETEFLYYVGADVHAYNVAANKSSVLISGHFLKSLNATLDSLSPDKKFVALKSDVQQVFRRSTTYACTVYDFNTRRLFKLSSGERIALLVWGPVGHSLAYVKDNDVYYLQEFLDTTAPVRLTNDGVSGIIYNGIPDWVYEEEILSSSQAVWFSKDGSHLAIASFNDTLVDTAKYQIYGTPGDLSHQYSQVADIRYPKPGRTNPTVRVRTVNLKKPITPASWQNVPAPRDLIGADHLLGSVAWASNHDIVVLWLNRRQNVSVMLSCDAVMGLCRQLRHRTEPQGWITPTTPLFGDTLTTQFLDIEPEAASVTGDRFEHVTHSTITVAGLFAEHVSKGAVTVQSVAGWDQLHNHIYYLASPATAPWQTQLWEGGERSRCISCGQCRSAQASFAPGARFYARVCWPLRGGPQVVTFREAQTDKELFVFESNAQVDKLLSDYAVPEYQNFLVPVGGGFNASVRLSLPPSLNRSQTYPMIVNIYAGPSSNFVQDKFKLGYDTYLSSNRSIIYCWVEGRGSKNMGLRSMHAVNRAFGTVEVDDVISAVKYLTNKYSFIDKTRVGLWGWSYGGYATGMALAGDAAQVFRCGASVAPVTDWIYYDSIYTERYMDVPSANPLGYARADLLSRAALLRGRRFFLLHGTADDNVHFQNAMALARRLELLDIDFRQMFYPDEDHGMRRVSRHLYHALDHFWTDCFQLDRADNITTRLG